MHAHAHAEQPRRRHPRVSAGFLVKLHTSRRILVQKARDLSMTGLSLEGCTAAVGERLVVEIPLPDEQRMVAVNGQVLRHDPAQGTTAVHFLDLDWDDMFALARFLSPRLP